MALRLLLDFLLFLTVVLGGAWMSDALIGITLPGDACRDLLVTVTVTLMTVLMLGSLLYLGVGVVALTHQAWPRWIRGRGWMHALGWGTVIFTLSTPFIVLSGPNSAVFHGERAAVAEAMGHAVPLQRAVAAFRADHGRYPADAAELGHRVVVQTLSTSVRSIELGASGVVQVLFGSQRYDNLDGRVLRLVPRTSAEGVAWDCRGGDLPDTVRPKHCRASSVCTVLGLSEN